jgi:hypothetical protein
MHSFINQELGRIIIDESQIKGIFWSNKFEDLTVDIDWCGQEDLKEEIDFNNVKSLLIFEFVTEYEINFRFEESTMGAIEITLFSFEFKEEKWAIEFKFRFHPVGYIRFNCNNFRFIVDTI